MNGGIKFFPSFKQWLGCQHQFQVKRLYRDPELIQWGKPSIWVANTDPRDDVSESDSQWLEGNCVFVHVHSSLLHIDPNDDTLFV